MKHPGLYVPLDVNYTSDEGIRRAGIAAELIFIRGLAYAKRTNSSGHLPDYDLPVIGVGLPPQHIDDAVGALVHWELWVPEEGGWYIRSWERWNSAPDEAEKERKKLQARERKRRQREREAEAARAAEEAAEVSPGQLKLVAVEGEATTDDTPGNPSGVTQNVTRDSHGVTPPKRREEKRSINTPPSPDGEEQTDGEAPQKATTPKPSRKKKPDAYERTPDFERFYAAYPQRKDPRAAVKAWHDALKRGADPEHLIAAATVYAQTWRQQSESPKYPATWLNKGSYDDEPLAPAANDTPKRRIRDEWLNRQ